MWVVAVSLKKKNRSARNKTLRSGTLIRLHIQRVQQPRDNYLPKNGRIGRYLDLVPQMTASCMDPLRLRSVALVQQQKAIEDSNKRVEDSAKHQHRSHRFTQQILLDQ